MAAERGVTVQQVEDEPGTGFFETTIEEGGVERKDRVPALYIQGGYEASQAYIRQQQLDTDASVVAYRAGKRGMCGVAVNPNVVKIIRARKTFINWENPKERPWKNVDPKQLSGPYFIDPADKSVLELTGVNKQTGAPIKIIVGFVRD